MKPLDVVTKKILNFYRENDEKHFILNEEDCTSEEFDGEKEKLIEYLNENSTSDSPDNYPNVKLWSFYEGVITLEFKKELKPKSDLEKSAGEQGTKLSYNNEISLEDGEPSINLFYRFLSFSINPCPERELLEKLIKTYMV